MKNFFKNKKYFILLSLIFTIIFLFALTQTSQAADPKLVTKLKNAFEKISSWLVKLATPAAAVAVGTGVMMKKFSFGDEDRVVQGKKLIRSTLFSYAFILSVDLVLKALQSLFG